MRDTSERERIDVAMDIVYNPDRGSLAVLEKGEWYQENRDRYNPDKGGNPLEVPGGGIDLSGQDYTVLQLRYEGLRELGEETDLAEEPEELDDIQNPREYVERFEEENTDVEFDGRGEPFEVCQDGVHHTFYPLLYLTDRENFQHDPEEHEDSMMVDEDEFEEELTPNEVEAARAVGVL